VRTEIEELVEKDYQRMSFWIELALKRAIESTMMGTNETAQASLCR
jgi:hypothetical protein